MANFVAKLGQKRAMDTEVREEAVRVNALGILYVVLQWIPGSIT